MSIWSSVLVKASNLPFWYIMPSIYFLGCSLFVVIYFSKAFANGNFAFSIVCLWLESNISSLAILSVSPDDNAGIFVASL